MTYLFCPLFLAFPILNFNLVSSVYNNFSPTSVVPLLSLSLQFETILKALQSIYPLPHSSVKVDARGG